MKKKVISGLISILFLIHWVPSVWAAITIPEKTDHYVNDYMNVLSQSTIDEINEKNDQMGQGAEILVLTTDYIETDTEEFSYQVFNQWEIGDAKKNNGVLIVLVIQEGKFWITTGTGVEDVLNSGVLSDLIYDYLEEDFDAGNYDRAVLNTFNEIWRILANKYGIESNSTSQKGGALMFLGDLIVPIVILIFVIFIIVISLAMPRRPYRRRIYRPRFYRHDRFGGPGPIIRPEPVRRPPFTFRPRSGGSAGRSFSGRSGGMRSGGGGRSRGGGAGRK